MQTANIVRGVFLMAFGLFWSGMVGLMDHQFGGMIVQQFASAKYPGTTGTITHSEVKVNYGSKHTSYTAKLEYRYQVAGHTWTGTRYRYNASNSSAGGAQKIVAANPVGRQVTVYYNPGNAMDSVLSPGLAGSDLALVLFATPFNMVALGFFVWGAKSVASAFTSPVAGGVRLIKDGFRTRVRLPVFTPIFAGIITTGGIAFLSIFLVMMTTNAQPPMAVAATAIAVAYGAGVLAFTRQAFVIAKGDDDLVLDEGSRTLELPLTYHRKTRMTVPFTDISSIRVETIPHSGKNGTTYTYAPTIYRNGDGNSEKLADWSDEDKAETFAAWLREQLRITS